MCPEALLLGGIVEAADEITIALVGSCRESFQGDERVRALVLEWLAAIGQAAARMPEAFRQAHPQISWEDVAELREFTLQSNSNINWTLVWWHATKEVPVIAELVTGILQSEFPANEANG